MAKSVSNYIAVIERLHEKIGEAVAFKWMPNAPVDPDPKATWDQILPLVEDVERAAKKLGIPPLASSQILVKEQLSSEFAIAGEWRATAVILRNPLMQAISLPVRAEEKVQGQWIPGKYYLWRLLPGQPFTIDCYFYEWIEDLKNPPGTNGIRDTGGGDCTWETHIEHERRKEIIQLQFSLGIYPFGPKPIENDAEYGRRADAILKKYDGATITPRYLFGVIDSYIRKLNSIIDSESHGIAVVPAQLRNISESVRSILTDAMPLNFSGAPDFPATSEMSPRDALVTLDRLRKCVIRRIETSLPKAASTPEIHVEEIVVSREADGPEPPNVFRWNARPVTLEPIPWKLLNLVWNMKEKKCIQDDIAIDIWGDDEASADAIKSALRRINAALLEVGCPLTISQKDGWFIIS
ncbi:MAG: hypothetical protein ABSC42_11585 [Tepidisphaeraceae bacterium]|jgi:hypothetical protein